MRKILIVSNAFDENTRVQRGVATDSPAASRKIFAMARALRATGIGVIVVSAGRGQAKTRCGEFFRVKVTRHSGVPVVYAPFVGKRLIGEFISLSGLAWVVGLVGFRRPGASFIFYNRLSLYWLALVVPVISHSKAFLDLEDGDCWQLRGAAKKLSALIKKVVFDRVCSDGVILASSALASDTSIHRKLVYYGAIEASDPPARDWGSKVLRFLFTGTLEEATGARVLLDALDQLTGKLSVPGGIEIFVTGSGPALKAFNERPEFLRDGGGVRLRVMGRLGLEDYQGVLRAAHVGLSLKLPGTLYAASTFPSKVIEFAENGLAIIATDVSDVRMVLGDTGAIYIEPRGSELATAILRCVEDRGALNALSQTARERVVQACNSKSAGRVLRNFLD